jgi:glycosyltransferase involved in cell wall biosynthesis
VKRLVFVGRITPEKGVHVLLEAMQEVVAAMPDCVLFLIGPFGSNPPSPALVLGGDPASERFEALKPGYERRLRDAAQPLGEHVRFVGVVPNDRLAGWYESCDVFVHPAVWDEPFGIVLAEAMACGLPVVSTRVGGIPEIVAHGETGMLVEPGDPKALAAAILELLRDDGRRRAMGAAGRRRVEQEFSWDRTAERLEEILLRARDA